MKRNPEEHIVYGIFENAERLQQAVDALVAQGIAVEDLSVMMTENTHDQDFQMLSKNRALDGAAAGGIVGGALGGILGGVAALGTALTGIGLMVVGPALALAAAGSLIGGLAGAGVPEDEAKRLQDAIHAGQTLLAVHAHDADQVELAKATIDKFEGETVAVR